MGWNPFRRRCCVPLVSFHDGSTKAGSPVSGIVELDDGTCIEFTGVIVDPFDDGSGVPT